MRWFFWIKFDPFFVLWMAVFIFLCDASATPPNNRSRVRAYIIPTRVSCFRHLKKSRSRSSPLKPSSFERSRLYLLNAVNCVTNFDKFWDCLKSFLVRQRTVSYSSRVQLGVYTISFALPTQKKKSEFHNYAQNSITFHI